MTYDGDGFPTELTALYSRYVMSWTSDHRLAHASGDFIGFGLDHSFESDATYGDDGRLASLSTTCSGSCKAGTRSDELVYDGARLASWTVTGFGRGHQYAYDDLGRVVAIDEERIEYGREFCPTAVMQGGFHSTPTYDADGRLTSDQGYPIDYDGPRVRRFEGTGPAFQDLSYLAGEAKGLDLWPGHFDGGSVYGFPVRGEVWRLDGTCDPTMTSQATILTLVLTALLPDSMPPFGG